MKLVSSASTSQSKLFKYIALLLVTAVCFAKKHRGRNPRFLARLRPLWRWKRVARRSIGAECLQASVMAFGHSPKSLATVAT